MIRTILLISLFYLGMSFGYGQAGGNGEFASFAVRQDSLFIKAYERRDIAGYDRLLGEFQEKFNKLSVLEQENYTGYRSGAYYNLCCTYGLLGQKRQALDYLERPCSRAGPIMLT